MIRFILIQNRQGKTRLSKWYVPFEDDEKVSTRSSARAIGRLEIVRLTSGAFLTHLLAYVTGRPLRSG